MSDSAVRILAALLEARTGQTLSPGRHWRVETALQPLLRERGFPSLDALAGALAEGGGEGLADETVDALLNNETFFYRDRQAFDLLLGPALDRLQAARAAERRLTIWSAGCSTGQEAYSIAMHFATSKPRWFGWDVDIVATDVSGAAIAQARSGLYSQFEVQRGLPVVQMMRWFDERPPAAWQLSDEIRRAVRFERRAIAEPPPAPGRFDIILCRNLLLYLCEAGRRAAFARLAEAAAPDALLMLGAGETALGLTDAFLPDPDLRGLYRRGPDAAAGKSAAAARSSHIL